MPSSGVRAVAELADIHARAQADVLAPVEGLDAGFGVAVFRCSHDLFKVC